MSCSGLGDQGDHHQEARRAGRDLQSDHSNGGRSLQNRVIGPGQIKYQNARMLLFGGHGLGDYCW